MAKRKGAGISRARSAGKQPAKAAASRARGARTAAARKKTAARKRPARPAAAKRAVAAARKAAPSTRAKKPAPRAAGASRRSSPAARTAAVRKRVVAKPAARPTPARAKARAVPPKKAAPRQRVLTPLPAPRKAPSLDRARRTAPNDDIVPSPPSSLDLDRTASAARSGRRGLRDRFNEHTETGPVLTGGDVDADWESAYSVGDEAPGGDSPTPDQDIVDDIGRAVGVEYQDNEELKGDEKIASRDRHRWELDPASAEDYDEH